MVTDNVIKSFQFLGKYEVKNFNMKNILLWLRVLFIRLPKEIWYQIEQLYWDEKLRNR